MKPSAKVREQAIILCSAMAAYEAQGYVVMPKTMARELDLGVTARRLAERAMDAVLSIDDSKPLCVDDAEAEALLRTGWSPGDPVERKGER